MKRLKMLTAVLAIVGIIGAGSAAYAAASDNVKPDEFKAQMLEQKKAVLEQRVKEGRFTQEQADEIYNAIKENQATCDGTGSSAIGRKFGAGFGPGAGMGRGAGMRNGNGTCPWYTANK